ncbi:MAG: lipopolysaccharide heptosyltransferase II [Deltaproteobacteria bacterium]|nr:lipopolysaccharide heptosyltransferase II [Deltaproteobacteria bacterium]
MTLYQSRGIEKAQVKRILIRATNWVGDAVMTLPALEAVREDFPGRHITVLAKPWVAPVFEHHPAVDRVLVFDKGKGARAGFVEMLRMSRFIYKERFDLAILFQNAFEAALLAFLGRVKLRVGYKTDGRGFMLTHGVSLNQKVLRIHQVGYYCAILRAMGWPAEDRDPSLHMGREAREQAAGVLKSNGVDPDNFIVGLSPGAVFGSAKRWPPDRFAEIGDRVVEKWGAKIVVFGSGGEKAIGDRVCATMKHRALNFCGKSSLGVAMGAISLCRFFVTNDSGLMHMASALGLPTVAVFGSTDHVTTGPRGPKTRIVRRAVSCAPCLKQECPTDHRCMLGITPGAVWETMEELRRDIS